MSRVIIDIEANSINPNRVTNIWCIVSKDIDTGEIKIFREVTKDETTLRHWQSYSRQLSFIAGHNWLGYDYPVLNRLLQFEFPVTVNSCFDTLVVSKLTQYSRPGGHSLESYGEEFSLPKLDHSDFTKWSQEMEDYCVRDVDINLRVYNKLSALVSDPNWSKSIDTEQRFQYLVVNSLHDNGFAFNHQRANELLEKVKKELGELDEAISSAFPPREVLVRNFIPRATKFGTISKTSVPRRLHSNIHNYKVGETYPLYKTQTFNPSSHKQLVDVLHEAGWSPTDKTKTHLETERIVNRYKHLPEDKRPLDLKIHYDKLVSLKKYGFRVNEENLSTLPESAPAPARILARRILLESRRRTLVEWLGLVQEDGRIHGRFQGIGAWTHRMAHQEPNTANIPNEFNNATGKVKLLGKELRQLWIAPKKRLLLGVDAEAIQFRIFAHYVNSKELTNAIVSGTKSAGTDPHSFNRRVIGDVCRTRQAAKQFIFSLLLGAGIGKLAEILACTRDEAQAALDNILDIYPGFAELRRTIIPMDAKRGYFIGLDDRKVPIPGDTIGERKHLCMSGYLQNGEAIIMKMATLLWMEKLEAEGIKDWLLVNFVHDEWQTEVNNNMAIAQRIGEIQSESLTLVGQQLKLNCPMAGSFYNEDKKDYTIGTNWYVTH